MIHKEFTDKDKKQIEELVEKFRLIVQMHKGDVKIDSIKNNTIKLDLLGACANCSLSKLTFNTILGGMIKEQFPKAVIKFNKKTINKK